MSPPAQQTNDSICTVPGPNASPRGEEITGTQDDPCDADKQITGAPSPVALHPFLLSGLGFPEYEPGTPDSQSSVGDVSEKETKPKQLIESSNRTRVDAASGAAMNVRNKSTVATSTSKVTTGSRHAASGTHVTNPEENSEGSAQNPPEISTMATHSTPGHNLSSLSLSDGGAPTATRNTSSVTVNTSKTETDVRNAVSVATNRSEDETIVKNAVSVDTNRSEGETDVRNAVSLATNRSEDETDVRNAVSVATNRSEGETDVRNAVSVATNGSEGETNVRNAESVATNRSEGETDVRNAVSVATNGSEGETDVRNAESVATNRIEATTEARNSAGGTGMTSTEERVDAAPRYSAETLVVGTNSQPSPILTSTTLSNGSFP